MKLVKGDVAPPIHFSACVPHGIVLDLDKGMMQQALFNLLINGIQAMEAGGKIIIHGEQLQDRGVVILEVIDTGVGISQENISRIFDPFFTTKDVGMGTGLGLSVTYGIIEKHGGKISVDSEVGRGTRFTIELPIRRDPEENRGK